MARLEDVDFLETARKGPVLLEEAVVFLIGSATDAAKLRMRGRA